MCQYLSSTVSPLLTDDPAAWAGLMAACHTENTSCYLSGSAARRQGLEQTLMSAVSEKGTHFIGWPRYVTHGIKMPLIPS